VRSSTIISLACIISLFACGEHGARERTESAGPSLRRNVAAICKPSVAYPFFLDLRAGGRYELNRTPYDSTRLMRWFEVQLAHRIPEQRIVMVRLDSTRRADLLWLIPAIERAGAGAYEPDATCAPPLRAPAAAAPAV
jgi:hypothetical protein